MMNAFFLWYLSVIFKIFLLRTLCSDPWRRKQQLLVFAHPGQSFVNTCAWTGGRLCHASEPHRGENFPNSSWSEASMFFTWLDHVNNIHLLMILPALHGVVPVFIFFFKIFEWHHLAIYLCSFWFLKIYPLRAVAFPLEVLFMYPRCFIFI